LVTSLCKLAPLAPRQESLSRRAAGRRRSRSADYSAERGVLCGSGVVSVPAYKRERNVLNQRRSRARASRGCE